MSVGEFERRLHGAEYAQNDLKYFPLWIRQYAASVTPENGHLPVSVELVKEFLRSLRQSGTPAWQRLQAVRAVEAYRDLVLGAGEPSLGEIRQALQELAEREHDDAADGASGPGVEDERHLVGMIDPDEPQCLQELRRELQVQRKASETERAYVGWVSRFVRHCGSEDLRQFGEPEIKSFLTKLVVEGNVAPNTQNQAKSALLFLYQQVFQRELAFLDAVSADKQKRLPVVLSREEIARVWPQFTGLRRLMFLLMYGAGLRHRECRRLRVKDICPRSPQRRAPAPPRQRGLLCGLLQACGRSRRNRQERRSAFSAPQFRDASAGGRSGYPDGARVAGPQGRPDDDDLSARDEQAGAGGEEPGGCVEVRRNAVGRRRHGVRFTREIEATVADRYRPRITMPPWSLQYGDGYGDGDTQLSALGWWDGRHSESKWCRCEIAAFPYLSLEA